MTTACDHQVIVDGCDCCAARSPYAHDGQITIGDRSYRLWPAATHEGTQVWPCAVALAMWLEGHTGLSGTRVCELGSGQGLPGLVAAHRGADVTFVERHPSVQLAADCPGNRRGGNVAVWRGDWSDHHAMYDTILASEVLFRPYGVAELADTIARVWNRSPLGGVWIANQASRWAIDPRDAFELAGLTATPWAQRAILPNGGAIQWTLWEVR